MHEGSYRVPWFFFQAEDGIRDHCVTGVQTCALPISIVVNPVDTDATPRMTRLVTRAGIPLVYVNRLPADKRSEERRVGKESRCRRAPYTRKKTSRRTTID